MFAQQSISGTMKVVCYREVFTIRRVCYERLHRMRETVFGRTLYVRKCPLHSQSQLQCCGVASSDPSCHHC